MLNQDRAYFIYSRWFFSNSYPNLLLLSNCYVITYFIIQKITWAYVRAFFCIKYVLNFCLYLKIFATNTGSCMLLWDYMADL